MREEVGAYEEREVNGVRILAGSVGGACTMTSRELYERVGGVKENRKHAYWRPDVPYQRAIRKLGYDSAFLADLEVRHQGLLHSRASRPKLDYHDHEWRLRQRKDRAKKVILRIPLVAAPQSALSLVRSSDPPLRPRELRPGVASRVLTSADASQLAVSRYMLRLLPTARSARNRSATRRSRRAVSALPRPSRFDSTLRWPRTCSRYIVSDS